MEEAEQLCDELAIIDHGKLIAQGTMSQLRDMTRERDILRLAGTFPPAADLSARLGSLEGLQFHQSDENHLVLSLKDAPLHLPFVLTELAGAGAEIRETTLTQPSLESLFIKLTGKELRE
jgi:ABC-2 type transport system ATP-binding protein